MEAEIKTESNSDWEEEEILVYADIDEKISFEDSQSVHVLGIDSSAPILQLQDNIFQGKFTSAMGTYMFFEIDKNASSFDPVFEKQPEKNLKYVCKTDKVIRFSRAYLHPKDEKKEEAPTSKANPPLQDRLELDEFNHLEEVLKHFENSFKRSECKANNSQEPLEKEKSVSTDTIENLTCKTEQNSQTNDDAEDMILGT